MRCDPEFRFKTLLRVLNYCINDEDRKTKRMSPLLICCNFASLTTITLGALLALTPPLDPNAALEMSIRGGIIVTLGITMFLLFGLLTYQAYLGKKEREMQMKSNEHRDALLLEALGKMERTMERLEASFERRNERALDEIRILHKAYSKQMTLCAEAHEMIRPFLKHDEHEKHTGCGCIIAGDKPERVSDVGGEQKQG